MAGLPGNNFYSKEYEDDWHWVEPSKRSQGRIRPSELKVQPMEFTPKPANNGSKPEEDPDVLKHVGVSVCVARLIAENVLSHPFVVLRRQCQVHHNSRRNHLMPVTLVPVVVRLYNCQGFATLWKGFGSTLLIKGMSIAIEDLLSKFTPWPNKITWHSSLKSFSQHVLLKCVSFAIMTPFYSSRLVETVQSDIASEKPGVFDVFKEGMCRLVSWGSPQKGRMLPVWALVFPTVVYGLLKYLFTLVIQNVASRVIHLRNRSKQEKRVCKTIENVTEIIMYENVTEIRIHVTQGAVSKDILSQAANEEIEETSFFIGIVSADIICYPLETILHRLYLQGTRTIVDNLDTGRSVIPILTNYEGIVDCYERTISEEGILGLYKGFGALVLQFAIQWTVVKLIKLIATELSILLRPSPKAKRPGPESETQPLMSPGYPKSPYKYPDSPENVYAPSYPYMTS